MKIETKFECNEEVFVVRFGRKIVPECGVCDNKYSVEIDLKGVLYNISCPNENCWDGDAKWNPNAVWIDKARIISITAEVNKKAGESKAGVGYYCGGTLNGGGGYTVLEGNIYRTREEAIRAVDGLDKNIYFVSQPLD